MPTMRHRRVQEFRPPLSGPMRVYLLTGDLTAAVAAREPGSTGFGGGVLAVLCGGRDEYFAAWVAHRTALLAAAHPAKPWAFFEFEHPELRSPVPDADDDLDDDAAEAAT
jgi:hypothetical protein